MAPRALFGIALASILMGACDVKQKTPETGGLTIAALAASVTAHKPVSEPARRFE